MKTSYDPTTDALYVRFAETPIEGSEEVAPGIILDFDTEHRLVAIEVLNAQRNLSAGAVPAAAQ
jgi:uncharacterized protein YuzE